MNKYNNILKMCENFDNLIAKVAAKPPVITPAPHAPPRLLPPPGGAEMIHQPSTGLARVSPHAIERVPATSDPRIQVREKTPGPIERRTEPEIFDGEYEPPARTPRDRMLPQEEMNVEPVQLNTSFLSKYKGPLLAAAAVVSAAAILYAMFSGKSAKSRDAEKRRIISDALSSNRTANLAGISGDLEMLQSNVSAQGRRIPQFKAYATQASEMASLMNQLSSYPLDIDSPQATQRYLQQISTMMPRLNIFLKNSSRMKKRISDPETLQLLNDITSQLVFAKNSTSSIRNQIKSQGAGQRSNAISALEGL